MDISRSFFPGSSSMLCSILNVRLMRMPKLYTMHHLIPTLGVRGDWGSQTHNIINYVIMTNTYIYSIHILE